MGITRRRAGRGALVALLVGGAATQLGTGCDGGCAQPYEPAYQEISVPTEPPLSWSWPNGGTARPAPAPSFDTDADGTSDTVTVAEDRTSLTVHRSSGDLTLVVTAPLVVTTTDATGAAAGDVDGDGRDDVLVTAYDPADVDPAGAVLASAYLVSGTTPGGVHALTDVAAQPFGPPAAGWPRGVGDVDADGHDDVVRSQGPNLVLPAEPTAVWSGADLDLAPGPPAGGPVAPTWQAPGGFASTLALDGGRTALALVERVPPDDGSVAWNAVVWLPETTLRFAFGDASPAYFGVELVDTADTTYLRVRWEYGRVASRWAWDLHDLCAPAAPPTTAT
jgi:hypothetical protein